MDILNATVPVMSPPASNPHTLDSTIGALLIGTFIGLMLYGFSIHQMLRYICVFYADAWHTRVLVFAVIVLDTAHSVWCMHTNYDYLIKGDALNVTLSKNFWSAKPLGVISGTIVLLCQRHVTISLCVLSLGNQGCSYYAHKVHKLRERFSTQVVVAVALLTVGQFGMTLAATVILFLWPDNQAAFTVKLLNCTHSGMAAAANFLLAASLIYSFHRLRYRGGDHLISWKTDTILRILTAYTINTGVLVGISTMLAFAAALAWPNPHIYIAIDFIATKIYSNTLLATINSRDDMPRTSPIWDSNDTLPRSASTKPGIISSFVMNQTPGSPTVFDNTHRPPSWMILKPDAFGGEPLDPISARRLQSPPPAACSAETVASWKEENARRQIRRFSSKLGRMFRDGEQDEHGGFEMQPRGSSPTKAINIQVECDVVVHRSDTDDTLRSCSRAAQRYGGGSGYGYGRSDSVAWSNSKNSFDTQHGRQDDDVGIVL
ncbi:uncharacterized protein BXZ73DRAFT_99242 [Epithele typhae]|uniref:uncharacterized protein n=1 Tax=Epithele typhae TaxID=378194 RepID=UPI002007BBE2|nr:uncharacterized protein BXZ73DRAFT_99242 [Epithele typhae]KAH9939626.1 hypothetical protein BXZ73DRAFT_99242 [Epithele typhae]